MARCDSARKISAGRAKRRTNTPMPRMFSFSGQVPRIVAT